MCTDKNGPTEIVPLYLTGFTRGVSCPIVFLSYLLDLDSVSCELVVPRRVSVDVVHTINQLDLKTQRGRQTQTHDMRLEVVSGEGDWESPGS